MARSFTLLLPVLLLLAGCAGNRAVVEEEIDPFEDLHNEITELQTTNMSLQAEHKRLLARMDEMQRQLDTTAAALEAFIEQQPVVLSERLARQSDSLRRALVVQFYKGMELGGIVRGRPLEVIYFGPSSSDLTPAAMTQLDSLAKVIRQAPAGQRFLVEGHADDTSYNKNLPQQQNNRVLSAERASKVVQYLVGTHKLNPARFETAGYGIDKPLVSNETAEGRQINRRVRIAAIEVS